MRKRIVSVLLLGCIFLNCSTSLAINKPYEVYEGDYEEEPVKIRATCYCDEGTTASGHDARYGIIAAAPKYLPKDGYTYVAYIYQVDEDGSLGDLIGLFDVYDTGYGFETGVGKSKILKNKTLGSIETGETIDINMDTLSDIRDWQKEVGDYVYIKLEKGKG
mgnify:CR=1 FL=1